MYRVFKVEKDKVPAGYEEGYEIFWCPSAPVHYNDRVPYDGKVYTKRPAAYRRVKQLNDKVKEQSSDAA
jgi:hypothetical protein